VDGERQPNQECLFTNGLARPEGEPDAGEPRRDGRDS
jgi:hypothetical protein